MDLCPVHPNHTAATTAENQKWNGETAGLENNNTKHCIAISAIPPCSLIHLYLVWCRSFFDHAGCDPADVVETPVRRNDSACLHTHDLFGAWWHPWSCGVWALSPPWIHTHGTFARPYLRKPGLDLSKRFTTRWCWWYHRCFTLMLIL